MKVKKVKHAIHPPYQSDLPKWFISDLMERYSSITEEQLERLYKELMKNRKPY